MTHKRKEQIGDATLYLGDCTAEFNLAHVTDKITADNIFHCRRYAQGFATEGQAAKRCKNMSRIEIRALADKVASIDDELLICAIEMLLGDLELGDEVTIDHPAVKNLQWYFANSFFPQDIRRSE